jgi:type VI secretion system secreted protein Hcp
MKRSLVFKSMLATALALGLAPLTSGSASATTPTTHIILTYPNVIGESIQRGYTGGIDITSFKWDTARAPGSSLDVAGLNSGKLATGVITLTKKVDAASTQLLSEHFGARSATTVTIDFTTRPSGATTDFVYLRYTLSNAGVLSYSVSSADNGVAVESITLNFAKILVEYTEYAPGTSTTPTAKPKRSVGYDLARQAVS